MHLQSLAGNWIFRQAGTDEWLPATVPGGVHTDLMAAGKIPDPFVADNEKKVLWVAESDWEYRKTFSPAADMFTEGKVFLVFDGLDTLADIYLNGKLLGHAENMYRQYRWEVKDLLHQGENELGIAFASPVKYVTTRQAERPLKGVSQAIPGGPYLRKAPCQFGWDWGPMLPPIGVWQDVRLEGRSISRFEDVHVRQRHADQNGKVWIDVNVLIERWQASPLTASLLVTSPQGEVAESNIILDHGLSSAEISIEVNDPQLWWPNSYGAQPLYEVVLSLSDGQIECDRRVYRCGLRTIELRQKKDEWGRSFTFVINGVPIMAKGSNWIPTDSFPTRITDAFLEKLISAAAATHQNMLRVWGGGFYEEDRFYDLCDRYGILVWQDGIFSCSVYPLDDPAFLENVRIEIVENVRRLRHHASLALWCGNNEMEQGWESWGWSKPDLDPAIRGRLDTMARRFPLMKHLLEEFDRIEAFPGWEKLRDAYQEFFFKTMPAWIAGLDPDRAYWPSSPSSNTPFIDVNGQGQGDAHYWDVWHGRKPFTAYREQYPRFMSEFGFQSLPPLDTIKTYAQEADWNMTSYMMEQHQRSFSGNGLMLAQMTDTFRMPKDFPSLVYLSMVLQAEGIRYGVEHWRRNRQWVSGILYWQLNDCWPVASWSSLDYFGRWKALHYTARRFYSPILLSIEDQIIQIDTGTELATLVKDHTVVMNVHVTNDTLARWDGGLQWSLETLAGEPLASGENSVSARPLQDTLVCSLDFTDRITPEDKREFVFVCELRKDGHLQALQVVALCPNKHINLVDPGLTTALSLDGDRLAVALSVGSLARFVELSIDGVDAVFSDNYFDVPAGRIVTVSCPLPPGKTLDDIRHSLHIRSLYDSYVVQ